MKAVVAAFNQGKALVGAFSVITNLRMEVFEALHQEPPARHVQGQGLQGGGRRGRHDLPTAGRRISTEYIDKWISVAAT